MTMHSTGRVFALLATLSVTVALPAQVAWVQRPKGVDPVARSDAVMTWDATHGEVVLFGGDPWSTYYLNDTWVWDGTSWIPRNPPSAPSPRHRMRMACDASRGVCVLFGGSNSTTIFGDTWEWNGGSWAQRTLNPSPVARADHCMAYDEPRGVVVLFGGTVGGGGQYVNDTWTVDGAGWRLHSPSTRPPARTEAAFCYDAGRGVCLLFGGVVGAGPANDTWQWDGVNWTQLTPPVSPPALAAARMVYDPIRDRVVLVGGYGALTSGTETWEWDGATWMPRSLGPDPGQRYGHSMAFHRGIERTVLFGGVGIVGTRLDDTWEYFHFTPAMYVPFGHGCPGSAGIPVLEAWDYDRPWIGEPFDLDLRPLGPVGWSIPFLLLGDSNEFMSGVPLPLDLDLIGMPGCSLFVSAQVSLPLANLGGTAAVTLNIPNEMRLVGVPLFVQGFVIEAGVGAVASDAGHLIIGAK